MEVNVPDSHISANDGQDLKPGLSDAKAEFFPLSSPAPYSSPSWSEELGHLMMEQKRIQHQNAKEPLSVYIRSQVELGCHEAPCAPLGQEPMFTKFKD